MSATARRAAGAAPSRAESKFPKTSVTLADFDLVRRLGDGSYSQVLLARFKPTNELVALKVMEKRYILRHGMVKYALSERSILARLQHPGVVRLRFTFQDALSLYMALEYCPNGELYDQIRLASAAALAPGAGVGGVPWEVFGLGAYGDTASALSPPGPSTPPTVAGGSPGGLLLDDGLDAGAFARSLQTAGGVAGASAGVGVKGRRGLDEDRVRYYAAQIVDVLQYLDSQDVAHRDLKPENLLLTAEGRLQLVDFGSAKDLRKAREEARPSQHRRKTSGGGAGRTHRKAAGSDGDGKVDAAAPPPETTLPPPVPAHAATAAETATAGFTSFADAASLAPAVSAAGHAALAPAAPAVLAAAAPAAAPAAALAPAASAAAPGAAVATHPPSSSDLAVQPPTPPRRPAPPPLPSESLSAASAAQSRDGSLGGDAARAAPRTAGVPSFGSSESLASLASQSQSPGPFAPPPRCPSAPPALPKPHQRAAAAAQPALSAAAAGAQLVRPGTPSADPSAFEVAAAAGVGPRNGAAFAAAAVATSIGGALHQHSLSGPLSSAASLSAPNTLSTAEARSLRRHLEAHALRPAEARSASTILARASKSLEELATLSGAAARGERAAREDAPHGAAASSPALRAPTGSAADAPRCFGAPTAATNAPVGAQTPGTALAPMPVADAPVAASAPAAVPAPAAPAVHAGAEARAAHPDPSLSPQPRVPSRSDSYGRDLAERQPAASAAPSGRKCSFVGTADYVAPEVLRNEPITTAVDLWSLGCVVHHMLTGTPPFRKRSEYATFEAILGGARAPLGPAQGVSDEAADLVARLLVQKPSERLGSRDRAELRAHPFFASIDWDTLWTSQPPPPAVDALELESTLSNASSFDWELTELAEALPMVEPCSIDDEIDAEDDEEEEEEEEEEESISEDSDADVMAALGS